MILKTNIEWRPYQLKVINSIIHGQKGELHCILSPRQCGKTTVAENLILYYALNFKNSFNIFMEPTNKQCKKVFSELKRAMERTSAFEKANESSLEISFINGSKIIFCSAEQSIAALQGYVCNGILIIDEAAYIQDEVIYALQPVVEVFKAPVVLASTPRFRSGLFYNYYIEGLKGANKSIISHNWQGQTLLSPEKLEFYRRTLPENVFKNYYLGEFASTGAGVFGDFSSCVSNVIDREDNRYYIGLDWSSGQNQDYTAISIFNSQRQMVYLEQFNDKDETATIERITQIVAQWKPIRITAEQNSIGSIFIGLLRKALKSKGLDFAVRPFNTTNESKMKMVNDLQVSFQTGNVQILNDEVLLEELNFYESALSPSGKLTYNAAHGHHDDLVLATMMALSGLKVATYTII